MVPPLSALSITGNMSRGILRKPLNWSRVAFGTSDCGFKMVYTQGFYDSELSNRKDVSFYQIFPMYSTINNNFNIRELTLRY